MIKVGGRVELTEQECEQYCTNGTPYILAYKTVYCLHYSRNGGWCYSTIYHNPNKSDLGYTRRGRFFAGDAKFINRILGFQLLNEEETV